jgi:integrase
MKEERRMKRTRGSGSLRLPTGSRVWQARFTHNGKLKEVSTGETDRKLAEKCLAREVKKANTDLFVDPSARKLDFQDMLTLVREDAHRKGNRTAGRLGTTERPTEIVKHLTSYFSGPVLHLTSDDVDKYGDQRIEEGAQPATVNRELAVLRRGVKLALRKGLIPKAPAVSLRREDNARQGFIDPPDFDRLLEALRARDEDAADLIEAAYCTLLRRGNITNLKWSCVMGNQIRLGASDTKNRAPLMLPLTGRLAELIERRREKRRLDCPYIFHRHGRRLGKFADLWAEVTVAVGRPGLLVHDLRRSGARVLRQAGIDESTIMALGGWKTASMFRRYAIVDSSDLEKAQLKITEAFQATPRVAAIGKLLVSAATGS